jgi:hypothetical protein
MADSPITTNPTPVSPSKIAFDMEDDVRAMSDYASLLSVIANGLREQGHGIDRVACEMIDRAERLNKNFDALFEAVKDEVKDDKPAAKARPRKESAAAPSEKEEGPDPRSTWQLVCAMEEPLAAIEDFIEALYLMATGDMPEEYATPILRVGRTMTDNLNEANDLRDKLFYRLHPDRNKYTVSREGDIRPVVPVV